ncbi:MAG: WYL domain-containing protein [Salinivirgaceae bacterium]
MMLEIRIKRLADIVAILRREEYPDKETILRELEKRIHEKFDIVPERAGLTDRTFERDKKEIYDLFKWKIRYSKTEKGYYLDSQEAEQDSEDKFNRMQDFVNKNNFVQYGKLIQLEPINSTGLEWLDGALYAIKQKKLISLEYENYNERRIDKHKVAPAFIKEFKRRTYIVGKDVDKNRIMTFSFERIHAFNVLDEHFHTHPVGVEYFNDCFGIVKYPNHQPQETLLKAYDAKANYIENHPLHHSQEVYEKGTNYTIFRLNVQPTYDFIIEILSHSHQLEVLAPEELKQEIIWRLKDTLKFYQ